MRVEIDRQTGEVPGYRQWTIVPDEDHEGTGAPDRHSDAPDHGENLQLGDVIEEPLEAVISAASAPRLQSR